MIRACLLSVVLVATTAQTAPPQAIRHLVYRVTASSIDPSQGASYDGTSTGLASSGMQGTITVDVLELAKDGGIVVRADEQYHDQPRSLQPVTCAVYGDGRVICPPEAVVSDSINVLLGTLGRGFYHPSAVAPDGTWTTHIATSTVSSVSRFTRTSAPQAEPVLIDEHTSVTPIRSFGAAWHSDTKIAYDAAMSVPDRIHDEAVRTGRSSEGWTTIDLTLVSDSFAKP